ncbi:MAG: thioredoxin TrxA [Alphaproteobacteria bacterium]|jgi:thioredoxin 1|nr:thioredoxin TrxA [Alphaproteobacteria bacterium]|tara:strand:- start:234 stop:554 length:321 start_codon:yes stop_codon:yes gene_type:complete
MNLNHVTDERFETEVLGAESPVLVDFWAEWCGPCQQIGPMVEELAEEFDGRLAVAKLDVDDNPATPAKFGVRGIPTLMIFKDGAVAATKVGTMPKRELQDWVDSHL